MFKSKGSKFDGLQVGTSMPVHHTIALGHGYLDQPAAAGPAHAVARLRVVHGTVGGTHQPTATAVEKAVGLIVHLHGNVGTLVQVAIDLAFKPDGKPSGCAPAVHHVKGNGISAVQQIGRVAQGDGWCISHVLQTMREARVRYGPQKVA